VDGVEVCRRLRADPITSTIPVIMLTAKGQSVDAVVGLAAGADDYVLKPFDTMELVARVRSTMRRNREIRGVSPLTGLPGNSRILAEIGDRVASGADYAVCYMDLDNFKSVNDAYGFVCGDDMITLLAKVMGQACAEVDGATPFVGHVGGDDFVVLCTPEQVEEVTRRTVDLFAESVQSLYEPADVERGYLELENRQGVLQRYALVTVSVGVAVSTHRTFNHPREVVAVATEMKQVAKSSPGSRVAVDRRGTAERADPPVD
jgi:diguanylate cyclase (GGDEF)-like protein